MQARALFLGVKTVRNKASAKILGALLLLWALLPSGGMAGFEKVMDQGLGDPANEATVSRLVMAVSRLFRWRAARRYSSTAPRGAAPTECR